MPAARPASNWRPYTDYQRLVVNPFLFVLVELTSIELASVLATWREKSGVAIGFVGAAGCLIFWRRLFQFHCLDCGQTARLLDWRAHYCPAVQTRVGSNRLPWPKLPDSRVQATIWGLYIFAATVWLFVWKGMPSQSG